MAETKKYLDLSGLIAYHGKIKTELAKITPVKGDGSVTVSDVANNGGKSLSVNISNNFTKDSTTGALKLNFGNALAANSTTGAVDVLFDNSTIKKNNNNELYVDFANNVSVPEYTIQVNNNPSTAGVFKEYKLLKDNIATGDTIQIPVDSALQEVYLGMSTDTVNSTTGVVTKNATDSDDPLSLNFIYKLANGTYSIAKVDVSKFLTQSEFGNGLDVTNGVVSVNIDTTSEKVRIAAGDNGLADVLSVTSNSVKVGNILDAIDYAISTLDVSDTAVDGKYVSQVSETDGKISVSREFISGATLNNYSKGSSAPGTLGVAATDSINAAISKLEWLIEGAKGAATVVAKDTNSTHLTVTPSTDSNTGAVTYTIGETGIANASDVSNLSKDLGKVGLTGNAGSKTITPTTNYGTVNSTAATTVMGNMQNIDTALKDVSDEVNAFTPITYTGEDNDLDTSVFV